MRNKQKDTNQMNLFDWVPHRQVLAFPLARRIGKIRRTAEVLERKQGKDADAYWLSQCRALADHLLSLGYSEIEMHQEIIAFQSTVQAELVRRSHGGRVAGGNDPRGAA